MKRQFFVALLLLLPLGTLAWAQADTLPDGVGKEIQSPEGLRKMIERKDPLPAKNCRPTDTSMSSSGAAS